MNSLIWLNAAIAVFIYVNLLFIPAYFKKRNDFVDVAWGPGFVVAAIGAWCASEMRMNDPRFLIAFIFVAIWATRLAWHIGARNLSHTKEDARYAKWREEWGRTWVWRSYLQIFILQGILMIVIDLPLLWILAYPPQQFDIFCSLGVIIWLFGFIFESVGDRQLEKFTKDPQNKGKIMDRGLWAWTRHPNYFGEVVQWWGIFCFAASLPNGWMTIISPVAITFLILKVSGVPMLEKLMEKRPGFAEYAQRTSIFFPRPPKKS